MNVNKLRAWVFLRGARKYWLDLNIDDASVCRMPEERLKVVALFSVLIAGRDEGFKRARELQRELKEIGYGYDAFDDARQEIEALFYELTHGR